MILRRYIGILTWILLIIAIVWIVGDAVYGYWLKEEEWRQDWVEACGATDNTNILVVNIHSRTARLYCGKKCVMRSRVIMEKGTTQQDTELRYNSKLLQNEWGDIIATNCKWGASGGIGHFYSGMRSTSLVGVSYEMAKKIMGMEVVYLYFTA